MTGPKTILVTGATGSIGSALVRRLCECGQNVRALARSTERAAKLRALPNVEVVLCDLSRPESLRGCAEGCALVYHVAAKLGGANWKSSYAVNVSGTQAVVEEAIRTGVERLVYTSTIGVYCFSHARDITEDFPWPTCSLPYIATKQEAERSVQAAASRIPTVIARLGDVIGPGQQVWTIDFIERLKQGLMQPPRAADSGYLNPVYIDNLIDALVLMGTHRVAPGQAFNVVDGTPILMSEYIRRLARMTGSPVIPLPGFVIKGTAGLLMMADKLRGREPEVTPGMTNMLLHKATIRNEKIHAVLGWSPAVGLEVGFQRTEEWLRNAGYLPDK